MRKKEELSYRQEKWSLPSGCSSTLSGAFTSLSSFLSVQEKRNGGISLKLYDCCGNKIDPQKAV